MFCPSAMAQKKVGLAKLRFVEPEIIAIVSILERRRAHFEAFFVRGQSTIHEVTPSVTKHEPF
jgi:hypothetical protein